MGSAPSTTDSDIGQNCAPLSTENLEPQDDEFRRWLHGRVLQPNETCNIGVHARYLTVEIGWDRIFIDVDVSAALLDPEGGLMECVYYHREESKCKAVSHSGDSAIGGEKGGDESISVALSSVPWNVHHILFLVALDKDGLKFNQVPNLTARVLLGKDPKKGDKLFELYLSGRSERAILVGKLTREGASWKFSSMDLPLEKKDIRSVGKMEVIQKVISDFPSISPSLRRVQATVMNGSNLVGKDMRFRFWKGRTSDPYYVIKFKGAEFSCPHRTKTLNPQWERHPFELGLITQTEPELLEISVFDYDKRSDDEFMGVVKVPGKRLYNLGSGEHSCRLQLEQSTEEAYQTETVSGEIVVKFIVNDESTSF